MENYKYRVTYCFFLADGNVTQVIETFNYFPTQRDINEVGDNLMPTYKAINFCASRGYRGENGWVEDDYSKLRVGK